MPLILDCHNLVLMLSFFFFFFYHALRDIFERDSGINARTEIVTADCWDQTDRHGCRLRHLHQGELILPDSIGEIEAKDWLYYFDLQAVNGIAN